MTIEAQREYRDPPAVSEKWEVPQDRPPRLRPDELPHAVRDSLGHYASAIRDEEAAARAKERRRWNWYEQRFAELTRVIELKVGKVIQEDLDDADAIIKVMAYHFQARCGGDEEATKTDLTKWCLDHCENWKTAWSKKGDIIRWILNDIRGRRRDLGASQVAKELHVTWEERCKLNLRTIRCCDLTWTQFKQKRDERKRERDRIEAADRRRKAGATPRDQSLARTQPWAQMDPPISKATYYRRGLNKTGTASETDSSQLGEASKVCDEIVSRPKRASVELQGSGQLGAESDARSRSENGAGSAGGSQAAAAPDDALKPLGVAPKWDQVDGEKVDDAYRGYWKGKRFGEAA